MKRSGLTAGFVLSTVALLTLTACTPREGGSGGDKPKVDETTLVESLPAGATAVDEVTWGIVEGEPATLDPGTSAQLITPNLCDNLLTLDPDFSISEGLAKKAEFVDPVTFQIDLRDDVTFWDGTALTPEDVIYSLERNRTPASQWYAAFALIKGFEKTGDHQVTVHFNAPDLSFRDVISGGAGAVLSKAYAEAAGPALGTSDGGLMCTGPYKLGKGDWKPGSAIVTTANENYWGGAPMVKTLKYVFVTDSATLTTALTEGEIEGAFNVPATSRSSIEGKGAGRMILGPSTASNSFGPTTAEGPAANPKVRQALSYAIDREQYVNTVMNGLGHVQKTIVPPFAFNKSGEHEIYQAAYDALDTPKKDIEKAKKLLEESGEDLSQPLVIAVPAGGKELQQTAQIIQASAKEIGVTIEINEMQASDFGAMFFDPARRKGIDLVTTTGYLETPGIFGYPSLFMLPPDRGGVFNWSGYDNPDVTKHLEAARTAPNEATSTKEFVAAQEIFTPDQLQTTLAGTYQLSYLNNDLTGITTSIAIASSPWALHLGGK
ncbi:ABC transporter substrate-binding protein [Arthrobacter sp. ISL-95]|uniref:ABC transporter substrate-binding protein n=1 Tax=Arthrobacter sp. ISL-95 TaxID=2819116 RepID=UPI001BEBC272|nr:ABC transporter substrate-binding protein [Arthrobacter sp. ISL-95]MBT2588511.1 ABC transporter substrate-binding protein [Arthrobacter sp. ISL-95]